MVHLRCLILVAGLGFTACSATNQQTVEQGPPPGPIAAKMILYALHCDKTTEAGRDEVYIMMAGKTSGRKEFGGRLPGEAQYWRVHDHGSRADIRNVELWQGLLDPGASVDLTFLLMEKDQGTPKHWTKLLRDMRDKIDPAGSTVGSTLDLEKVFAHPVRDTDDLLGAIHVRLANQAGRLTATWRRGDRTESDDEVPPTPSQGGLLHAHHFEIRGDGAFYRAFVTTEPSYQVK